MDCGPDRWPRLPQVSFISVNRTSPFSNINARLSDRYEFQRPNDRRALDLMNAAAVEVLRELPDLCIAYGVSDEYRSVLHPSIGLILCGLELNNSASSSIQAVNYSNGGVRKSACVSEPNEFMAKISSKLVSTIVSTFTAYYIYHWEAYFPSTPLQPPHLPSFDGRAVLYPATGNLRDYMSWRQVDCEYLFSNVCYGAYYDQVTLIISIIRRSGRWFSRVG